MKKLKLTISVFLVLLIITSCMTCALFTVNAENTVLPEENSPATLTVPVIRVTTKDSNGTTLQKEDDYVQASIVITDTDGSTIEDDIQFKVRGNSTAVAKITKKAFTFKFDSKKDVLGMGKAKKWALLANAFDPTQMRNFIAFELARTMGLEYTSEQRFVELWIDNSYRGCYILTEPVEQGSTRVDIDIDSNDGKKDFLIEKEFNRYEKDVTYFYTDDIRFAIKEPEEPDTEQLNYIKTTMNDIMDTIKEGNQKEIESKIDIPSFTRYYVLNELFKTLDFDYSSVFFYYKDGVLYCGPVWDYDLSSGNVTATASDTASETLKTEGLFANHCHFYKYLCSYDWFNNEIRQTYTQYYDYIRSITAEDGIIDTLLEEYSDIFNKNFSDTDFNVTDWWVLEQKKPLPTFDENVEYLRDWLDSRQIWLSAYYDVPFIIGDVNNDKTIDVFDATVIQFHLAEIKFLTQEQTIKADFDNNNEISIMDATAIQRHIARL